MNDEASPEPMHASPTTDADNTGRAPATRPKPYRRAVRQRRRPVSRPDAARAAAPAAGRAQGGVPRPDRGDDAWLGVTRLPPSRVRRAVSRLRGAHRRAPRAVLDRVLHPAPRRQVLREPFTRLVDAPIGGEPIRTLRIAGDFSRPIRLELAATTNRSRPRAIELRRPTRCGAEPWATTGQLGIARRSPRRLRRAARGRPTTRRSKPSDVRHRDRRGHDRRPRRSRSTTTARRERASYREFPQHFPAAGLGRARRRRHLARHRRDARRGRRPRSTRRARRSPRSASPTSARPSWCGTGAPAGRVTARSCGRTGAPPRGATSCARPGTSRMIRRATGLVLDPYFSATKLAWLLHDGGVAADADLAFGTVDTWLLWNLTGGVDGGVHATDPSNASRTMLYDIGDARLVERAVRRSSTSRRRACPRSRRRAAGSASTRPECAAGLAVSR